MATPIVSIVHGAVLSALWRVPLVALSDELYTERDSTGHNPRLRNAMYRAHAKAALTVITDQRRATPLREEFAPLESQRFVELGNSPAGVASDADPDEFRQQIRVARDVVLVLHSGGLWSFARPRELLSALPSMPVNTLLVLQMNTRADDAAREQYRLLEEAYPVRFLPDPVPYGQIDDVVTACDIGVALYSGDEPNTRLCGKGSGKLNRYLRAGKPVIVDRTGGLEWAAEYGAGEIITGGGELPQAIERIMADYGRYARRARECHAEHLSFERHWPVVRAALTDVIGHNGLGRT